MDLNFNFDSGVSDTVEDHIDTETIEPEIVNHTPFDKDDRFSIVKAEQSFAVIKNQLDTMGIKAKVLEVKDNDTNTTAMEMLVQCRALVKASGNARKSIPAYKTASEFKSGVDTFIREQLKKPIEAIERLINPKVSSYQKAQAELQRRIEQKKAAEEADRIAEATKKATEEADRIYKQKIKDAEELQQSLNKEADGAGVERVQVNVPEFEEPETVIPSGIAPIVKQTEKVKTGQGSSTIKSSWVCIVDEPLKVPRKYCTPSQKLLDAAVEEGERNIPGCRIEEKFEAKVRMSSKRTDNIFGSDEDNKSF